MRRYVAAMGVQCVLGLTQFGCASDPKQSTPETEDFGVAADSRADTRKDSAPDTAKADDATDSTVDGDPDVPLFPEDVLVDEVTSGSSDGATELPDSALLPPVCRPETAWGEDVDLATVGTPDDNILASVTPNETVIAWFSIGAGGTSLQVADASSSGFGPAATLTMSVSSEGATLAPTGLALIAVAADNKRFLDIRRTKVGAVWTASAVDSLKAIHDALAASETVADPVLTASGLVLLFSRFNGDPKQTVWISRRTSLTGDWSKPTPWVDPVLEASAGKRKRPSGISSDERAFYFFDEGSKSQKVSYRNSGAAKLGPAVELGARPSAQPNRFCSKLYFTRGVTPKRVIAYARGM